VAFLSPDRRLAGLILLNRNAKTARPNSAVSPLGVMADNSRTAEPLDFIDGFLNAAGRRRIFGYLRPPEFESEPIFPILGSDDRDEIQ